MKRFLSALLLILLITSIASCTQPAGPAETPAPAKTQTQNAPTEAPSPSPLPTPEPKLFTPMDIFGSDFNPYAGMELPSTLFAASFTKGSAKHEGNPFKLYMTGSGNMFAAVAFHADFAGLSEDEKNSRINEYLSCGFTEFEGKDGRIVTIRRADSNDDSYEYVKADGSHGQNGAGCVIETTFDVNETDIEKYTDLVRDNYNLNALTSISDYFDVETDFRECGITVNLHKNEASTYTVYYIPNADAVQKSIEKNIQGGWWEWNGMMQTVMRYGAIESKLTCDGKGGAISIEQTNTNPSTAMGEFVEAEVSLTKFGFGFDDAGTCGVYEQHEPYYMNVAIHRPEWGEYNEDWNIEYLDTAVNGYGLRITYHAAEDKYHINVDKGNEGAAFDYFPATKEYKGEYPDKDTVQRMFNSAFNTKDDEFYGKPLAYFEQLVKERFGMGIDELYSLPIS